MDLDEKIELWWSRFSCREDLYGLQTAKFDPDKGKLKKHVTPVYIEKYRSKKMREGQIFNSPRELYEPLSKEAVKNHLLGHQEVLIYLPRLEDDTTNFAAIDFDYQHGFDEVQKVSRVLDMHGVPYGIARSTSKGHHIYIFFDGPIKAYLFTNLMNRMFIELGYYEKLDNDYRDEEGRKWSNPEIFPKVITIRSPSSTGYGIKPAMNMKALENDRCCFVDNDDSVIGGKGKSPKQWEHFSKIPLYNVEKFKKLIKDLGIDVDKDMRLSEKRGAVNGRYTITPYEEPTDGDFMAIINGCPALRRWWRSPAQDVPHDARVAMIALSMKCKGGLDLIREHWGNTEMTQKQIEHSTSTNQQPWCCRTLQLKGACLAGRDPLKSSGNTKNQGEVITDYCFEKSPPREIKEGKIVINPDDLPVEEWPWPSPVRLRKPFKRTGMEGLKQEINQMSKDDPELDKKLEDMSRKIAALKDKKSRDKMFNYLKAKNLTLVKTLKHFYEEAIQQKSEEEHKGNASFEGYREINGISFVKNSSVGYSIVKEMKDGQNIFVPISNFEIELQENRLEKRIIGDTDRVFTGFIKCNTNFFPLTISAFDYSSNAKFSASIYNAVGPDAVFDTKNLEYIRSAIKLFGCENTRNTITNENYGFNDGKKPSIYRTQSGGITADGYLLNEKDGEVVDLSRAKIAQKLDLLDLSKNEFKEVAGVLVTSYLKLQKPEITYTVLAHSLQAVIHNVYIPLSEAPCLYLDGTTGTGKTEIAKLAMKFHGSFEEPISIHSTLGAINLYLMMFKDSLFVLDDFKSGYRLENKIVGIIQKAYDRSERGRLKTDFSQGDVMRNRSLMMLTGESLPTSEASVIARLIHIQCDSKVSLGKEATTLFEEVKKASVSFSGVTAKFIEFMLKNYPDKTVAHERFSGIRDVFKNGVDQLAQNGHRVVNNLAANFCTWELFLEFLLLEGVISQSRFNELHEIHRQNLLKIRGQMLEKCQEEQASNLFLNILKQLVASESCKVDGLTPDDSRGETIGFMPLNKEVGAVYLYPDLAYKAVVKSLRESGQELHHSKAAIGKQLVEDEMILVTPKNGGGVAVERRFKGSKGYVWVLDGIKAGLIEQKLELKPAPLEELWEEMPIDQM